MARQKSGILIEEHSVSDLFAKLDEIISHQKYTNGKVAENVKQIAEMKVSYDKEIVKIKKYSISFWIRDNPLKSLLFAIFFTLLFISDFRQPLITALLSLAKLLF